MTQIRVPTNVARTNKANTWTGTQDFSGATVLGVAGGGGGGTVTGATSTAAGVVQLAGDLAGTYTAPTVPGLAGKADKTALAAVATSGNYTDLTGRPALAPVATSGNYTDLTGRPALAPVASSGNYTDLAGRPALATVATSGAYTDLTGAPAAPILRGKTTTSNNPTVTYVLDPELQVASLPTGTYALECFCVVPAGNATSTQIGFNVGGTSVVTGMVDGDAGTGTNPQSGSMGIQFTVPAGGTVRASGSVICTTAGSFGVAIRGQTATTAGLGPGSWLRLTKVA